MRRSVILLTALAIAPGFCAAATQAASPSTFTTGIADPVYFQSQTRHVWLDRTVASGAQFVLLWVSWSSVSPQRPAPRADPSNPADPQYNWGTLDATVRAARSHGLRVVLSLAYAPAWAEGRGRPAGAPLGTWRPNARAFAAFARAVARRYSGSFSGGSGVLPRVRYFQAWTEPNLPDHLNPQWVRAGRRWVAESPIIYRTLLNAFYAAVKSVRSSDVVITAGTAPFGDPPGGKRVAPALFVRDLLCLRGRALAPGRCPDPAHFDVLAHDPYSFGGPLQQAFNPDDVALPDMWKLTRALAAAQRTGRALPRIHHPVWVTEFGWSSKPPNPSAVPLIKRAHWIERAFYELWRQGIATATWYLIVDQAPIPSYAGTWQTGLYYLDGRRKPGFEAFRFPFLVVRATDHRAAVWGVSPDAGTVHVQLHESGRWRTALRVRVRAHEVIDRTIAIRGRPLVRAVVGANVSLGWRA
jgi:hypothetical protein